MSYATSAVKRNRRPTFELGIQPGYCRGVSDDMSVALGAKLAALRIAKGLTQQALAKRAGIARTTVTDYERNDIRPTRASLAKLAEALGVSPTEIGPPFDPEAPRAHRKPGRRNGTDASIHARRERADNRNTPGQGEWDLGFELEMQEALRKSYVAQIAMAAADLPEDERRLLLAEVRERTLPHLRGRPARMGNTQA